MMHTRNFTQYTEEPVLSDHFNLTEVWSVLLQFAGKVVSIYGFICEICCSLQA